MSNRNCRGVVLGLGMLLGAAPLGLGCSPAEDGTGESSGGASMAGNPGGAGSSGGSGSAPMDSAGSGDGAGNTGNGNRQGSDGATGSGDGGNSAGSGPLDTTPPPEVMEMLDPDVDWNALQLVFPVMYSAHDGVHLFQVPARVDGATLEIGDWQAIPASAASFDPDPEGGGVIITVLEPVAEITIAASTGQIGGTAPLYVTSATPEEWAAGEARYANGVDYMIPELNFLDLFDPNYVPPPTPTDLACNNCHTTGAKYFEIQHTPAQLAYVSDEQLEIIFTEGRKPEGVSYSLLPMELEYLYPEFHTWDASESEIRGLIVYLRSLTPELQGEIVLPDAFGLPPAP